MYAWTLLPKTCKTICAGTPWKPESGEIRLIYSLNGADDCISLSALIYNFEKLCKLAGDDITKTVIMELSLEQRVETLPVLNPEDVVGYHEITKSNNLYYIYTSVVSEQRLPTFTTPIVTDGKGNLYWEQEKVTGPQLTSWIANMQTTTPWFDMTIQQLWSTCSLKLIQRTKEMFFMCEDLATRGAENVTYKELLNAWSDKQIVFFGKHGDVMYQGLDNFYKKDMFYQGRVWSSAENAYQAQKSADLNTKELFIKYEPEYARLYGNLIDARFDWHRVDDMYLDEILSAKFEDSELRDLLLSTGDSELVYDTTETHDNDLGHCRCAECISRIGQNRLGKALMKLREQLS